MYPFSKVLTFMSICVSASKHTWEYAWRWMHIFEYPHEMEFICLVCLEVKIANILPYLQNMHIFYPVFSKIERQVIRYSEIWTASLLKVSTLIFGYLMQKNKPFPPKKVKKKKAGFTQGASIPDIVTSYVLCQLQPHPYRRILQHKFLHVYSEESPIELNGVYSQVSIFWIVALDFCKGVI